MARSEANPTVQASKLVLCLSLINLVFVYHLKDHHLQSPDFLSFIFIFQNQRPYLKMAIFCEFLSQQ